MLNFQNSLVVRGTLSEVLSPLIDLWSVFCFFSQTLTWLENPNHTGQKPPNARPETCTGQSLTLILILTTPQLYTLLKKNTSSERGEKKKQKYHKSSADLRRFDGVTVCIFPHTDSFCLFFLNSSSSFELDYDFQRDYYDRWVSFSPLERNGDTFLSVTRSVFPEFFPSLCLCLHNAVNHA